MKRNKTAILTTGVFDCLHIGHINLLERAANLGDMLIVGVVGDAAVKSVKGQNRPLMKEADRWRIVDALKCVDHAFIVNDFNPNLIIQWFESIPKLGDYNCIYVFGSDQDHFSRLSYPGVMQLTLPRTEGVSTSKLIERMNQ